MLQVDDIVKHKKFDNVIGVIIEKDGKSVLAKTAYGKWLSLEKDFCFVGRVTKWKKK